MAGTGGFTAAIKRLETVQMVSLTSLANELRTFLNVVATSIDEKERSLAELQLSQGEISETNQQLRVEVKERRQAEQRLESSEAHSRAVVSNAADGIVTINDGGYIKSANRAAAAIFGLLESEMVGRRAHELIPEHATKPGGDRLASATPSSSRYEVKARRSDGADVYIELCLSEFQAAGEKHSVAILRDLTQAKASQAEILALNRQLLDASRLAGMAEISTGILHNVGNALTSVNVSMTMLEKGVETSNVLKLEKLAAVFSGDDERCASDRGAVKLLDRLTAHLLAERGSMREQISNLRQQIDHIKAVVSTQQRFATTRGVEEVVSVQELLDAALRLNEAVFEEHSIQVTCEYAQLPPLVVDRHKVMQIVLNLLSNARDALEDCAVDRRSLAVRLGSTRGDFFRISVIDSGVGIEPADLDRVFQHGFSTKDAGHGFGLHNSANTAAAMGGSLTASSDGSGAGAAFVLELPAKLPTA